MEKEVLLVCPRTPLEKVGGIENLVVQIAEGLKKRGFRAAILTTAINPRKTKLKGILIEEFPVVGSKNNYFYSPKLINRLKNKKADIVHCFGYNNLVTFFAMVNKRKDHKLIVTLASAGTSSFFRKFLLFFYQRIFSFYSKNIDVAVYLSDFEKKIFEKIVKAKKSLVIPIGVDLERTKRIKISKRHEIVSAGRLVKNKGFDRLLKVFKIVNEKDSNLKLRIIGDGPEKKNLKNLAKKLGISEKVEFVGQIPFSRRDVYFKEIKRAKIFAFLSHYESQGVVISEAIATGLPVLLLKNSAQKEFIQKGLAIGVGRNDSDEETANKLINVLKNPDKFKVKWAPLSIKKATNKNLRIYESILG